jgi:hypothetical protein
MYRIAAALVALGVVITGCAGIGDGSTTCSDFNGMTNDARGAAVAKMLKERNGRNSSTADVQSRVASTLRACSSADNRDKTLEAVNF